MRAMCRHMTDLDQPTSQANDGRRAREVYFDGGCTICSREIAVYRRMTYDDEIFWRDISVGEEMAAPDLSRQDALTRLHVRRADGRLLSGAAAFLGLKIAQVYSDK